MSSIEDHIAPDDLNHLPVPLAGTALRHAIANGAILYVRASTPKQLREGRRDRDETDGLQALNDLGIPVVKVIRSREKGYINEPRPALRRAFRIASRRGCVVVAWSRDRFTRSARDRSTRGIGEPSPAEYLQLRRLAGFVCYCTILDPSQHGRSTQTSRGIKAKKQTLPGAKKDRRADLVPQLRKWLRQGRTSYTFAAHHGLPVRSVYNWEKRYCHFSERSERTSGSRR